MRTVATTDPLPIPPLVATAPLADDQLARLRDALLGAHEAPRARSDAMARLLLAASPCPSRADYDAARGAGEPGHPAFEDL